MAMKLKCRIKRQIRPEVKRAGTCPERESEKQKREKEESSPSPHLNVSPCRFCLGTSSKSI